MIIPHIDNDITNNRNKYLYKNPKIAIANNNYMTKIPIVSNIINNGNKYLYKTLKIAITNNDQCLRATYGAMLFVFYKDTNNNVKYDIVIGNTHVPKGLKKCTKCYRKENNIQSGTRYECCRSIHAEQDCINKLKNKNIVYTIMFLNGIDSDKNPLKEVRPCVMCMKALLDNKINYIITPTHQCTVKSLLQQNINNEYDVLLK